jgi:hypothetical protein
MILSSVALILAAVATQDRPVDSFHAIQLSGDITANIVKGSKPALKLEGERDDLANLESVVKDGSLILRPKARLGKGNWSSKKIVANITVTELYSLEVSGGCVVSSDIFGGSKQCTIDISGGVELNLNNVACTALNVDASGGAELKATGQADSLLVDASGGVTLKLGTLNVKDAKIDASGGVTGKLAVSDSIAIDVSGGVSLNVKGKPKIVKSEQSGGASVDYAN